MTGIGWFFFKSKNPNQLKEWYKKHLGIPTDTYGWIFWRKDKEGSDCSTQWSPFLSKTSYFQPSEKQFMMNFIMVNSKLILKNLEEEVVTINGNMQTYDYGTFIWVLNLNRNIIQLLKPIDSVFL